MSGIVDKPVTVVCYNLKEGKVQTILGQMYSHRCTQLLNAVAPVRSGEVSVVLPDSAAMY